MGNAIFIGDVHLKGKNPTCRKDNYAESILEKLSEVEELCVQNDVTHVFFLGDIFDTVNISIPYLSTVLTKFLSLQTHLKLYTIIGNHDIRYDDPDTLDSCPLGLLVKAGAITILDSVIDVGNVSVHGNNWNSPLTANPTVDKHSVLLLHKFYSSGFNEEPLRADECLELGYNTYILGHDHRPYETVNIFGDCQVYRPGSLARNSSDNYNKFRIPRILLLDTVSVEYSYITLQRCHAAVDTFVEEKFKDIPLLELVPHMHQAWAASTFSPREFCKTLPEEVQGTVLAYLNVIGA